MIAQIAASEHALLTVARAVVRQVSATSAGPVLRDAHKVEQLGPTSMRLLQATLAKGVVLELGRRGGWRSMRHLQNGMPVAGRLWERHTPPQLKFSAVSFELLRWLAVAPLKSTQLPPLTSKLPLTLADEVLLYLAADLLVRADLAQALERTELFHRSPLVWLGFFLHLGATKPPPFNHLMSGDGAVVLEALQWDLARQWARSERQRRRAGLCEPMQQLCAAEDAVLELFLQSCELAGRRDLGGFLIEAAANLLARPVSPDAWCGTLELKASLRDRSAARRATGVFLRQLATLQRWAGEARHTAFFEDNYQAAQAFASRWEALGDAGYERAQVLLRGLDALDMGTGHAPT